MGCSKADVRIVETKAPIAQVMELQLFQIGPKKPGVIERGSNKKAKSPNRKKSYAHAIKLGKQNVGICTSNLQKENAMKEITQMEVEEIDVGPKQKTRAPFEEVMENAEVGKRPKLEDDVVAFGRLLATQMGSVMAVV